MRKSLEDRSFLIMDLLLRIFIRGDLNRSQIRLQVGFVITNYSLQT